jgi:squalene synthase HpnC
MTALTADIPPLRLLDRFGPERCESASPEECGRYVLDLAGRHEENFSVISALLPAAYRSDFAAIYAYCRWSDDLADETGADLDARRRSIDLLGWWRERLDACFDGRPDHPVFIALRPVIESRSLPAAPFHRLIDAFEQDQRRTRYDSMEELVGYCRGSADPVGRLVLLVTGQISDESDPIVTFSDDICTGLQLVNHLQDVRRDLDDRDRIYLPLVELGLTEEQLRDWAAAPETAENRAAYARAVEPYVKAVTARFYRGADLIPALRPDVRPVVRLFLDGGRATVRAIERIDRATLWRRPTVARRTKARLIAHAWLASRLGRRSGGAS